MFKFGLQITGGLPWEQKFQEKGAAKLVVKKGICVRESVIVNNHFGGGFPLSARVIFVEPFWG